MKGWSKATTYVGVIMLATGFLLIVLGWNGAASFDTAQQQLPYVISGGLGGLALVGAGLALLVVQELRRTTMMLSQKLDEVADAGAGAGATGGPTAVPDSGDAVIAGRTTYHRPTCHLVEGRQDLQVMAPSTAADRGLAACRICEPAEKSA